MMPAGKGWNVDFPHCIFGEWNSSLSSSSALALWPSLPVNCYSDDEGANDRDDPARRQSASLRGSNGQALTGGFRAAAKANAYRYADITAARKQAKFHASIGVMLSISAFG
jgi:hypothetical protein